MDLDRITKDQEEIGQNICRLWRNFKKDSPDRKTKIYLEEKLQQLNSLWEEFDATDSKIREIAEIDLNHPYFSRDYYGEIKKLQESFLDDIQDKLELANTTKLGDVPYVPSKKDGLEMASKGAIPTLTQEQPAVPRRKPERTSSVEDTPIRQRYNLVIGIIRGFMDKIILQQNRTKTFCQIKIRTLEQNWEEVTTMYRKMENQLTQEDIQDYFELQEQLAELLQELYGTMESSLAQELERPSTTMKMPKVELPKFDGNYLQWQQFNDLYTEMIHNQKLSDGQKMWFLKSSLTGEAEKLVRHLTVSGANYSAAWRIITGRYDNPRLLISSWISKMLSHQSVLIGNARSIRSLHDTIRECLLGLEGLDVDTKAWDPILLHLFLKKLDKDTHTLYEQSLVQPRQLPSFQKFLEFLETRFQALETLGNKDRADEGRTQKQGCKTLSAIASQQLGCIICKYNHPIYKCKQFLELTSSKRLNIVKQNNLCVNCLRAGHFASTCSSSNCSKCHKKHNTLLHLDMNVNRPLKSPIIIKNKETTTSRAGATAKEPEPEPVVSALLNNKNRAFVLLGTARVNIVGPKGKTWECRALLDSGSQINIISQRMVNNLGLTTTADELSIEGIGQGKQRSNQRINIELQSRVNSYSCRIEAFVLPKIISYQPAQPLDTSTWDLPSNIPLADPNFNRPDKIDILLGAEFYHQLLVVGQIRLAGDLPILQNTVLGWVIAGKVSRVIATAVTCATGSEERSLTKIIEKFWRLEDIAEEASNNTRAEQECERHFQKTFQRDPTNGRFIVSLPFSRQPSELGESREIALRRFLAMERRLNNDAEFKHLYVQFMQEFIDLGHMSEVDESTLRSAHYFLPHHGVLKPESTTTKLRVVFDASMKTSSNISLNEVLLSGPTIQDDIFSILLRFRTPRFVFTADIEKMYRQILVRKEDRGYQLIFWRSGSDKEIKCYQLNTVTYGTTSAPYLATRCLQQLAEDNSLMFPLGAKVLANDLYMDDVMSGSNNLSEAIAMQKQLIQILQSAQFKLRKWCSNVPQLLRYIPPNDQAIHSDVKDKDSQTLKTLGLSWNPRSDEFLINSALQINKRITKRTTLSEIAHIFDPLGIVNPITITAKIFIQQLWKLKFDWDAALPMELHTQWDHFRRDLVAIKDIKIPRHLFSNPEPRTIQLHAFADASGKAFGAAIYIRSTNNDGTVTVRLVCSKSRVAPIKSGCDEHIISATTIPRLELCAAKLATELMRRVVRDMKLGEVKEFFWTDSEIVLAWINSEAANYHSFIANRVRTIRSTTIPQQWRHVPSKQNPADIVSRGTSASKLKDCTMWFYGPLYLYGPEHTWPGEFEAKTTDYEKKRSRITLAATLESAASIIDIIDHHNSFRRLQRVVAYINRFINNCMKNDRGQRLHDHLSLSELEKANHLIIREVQGQAFKEELKQLTKGSYINAHSPTNSLSPFLDGDGIMRVGGRLEAAERSYDAKHPILLPYNHKITKLLMHDVHLKYLHIGPQGLLAAMRQKYWPVKGKTMARSVVQKCIRCSRAKPKLMTQIMGNLPAMRVQPARPFVNAGVDFLGPVWIHFKVRGKQPRKAYVAVFCCFATKAVHLEVVGDLTTEAFIGALKRFVGRRGNCLNLYCDNATNFVGARNQLMEIKSSIYTAASKEKITSFCTTRSMEFHFIPPRAPHFGGLWEAAVKSAKHFLKRNLLSANLTYEELETLLIEIEAILNSRPLVPLSSDPNDLTALTPGHFLIGEPLTSSVDGEAEPTAARLGNRWRTITTIKTQFWQRWSHEYLNELQHRYKWKQANNTIVPGMLVIIKDDNLPPMQWQLGRIMNCIRGSDGLVRVAEVKTNRGMLKRPIHNLAPLPVDENPQQPGDQEQPSTMIQKATEPSTNKEESPKKRVRRSLGSTIATILLALLTLPLTEGLPVELIPFDSQSGIYFENMGAANILSSEWKIIAYYDMEIYAKELQLLTNTTSSLKHLCHLIKSGTLCEKIIIQIQNLEGELVRTNRLLIPPSISHRMKRGALNLVGNVANSLFGILDSDYADQISRTIEGIKTNAELLRNHIKNQTSFLAATINIMNRDQETIAKQFEILSSHIAEMTYKTNNISRELYQEDLAQTFISLAIQILTTISNFQRIQGSLLDVVTHSQHGKISPLLMPPAQLQQELRFIKEHLPSSLKLPASYMDLTTLLNLMTIEGKILPKHAIFEITIPLISAEDFEIFHVIPVPVLVNGTFTAIQPSSPYIVINLHRDLYYAVSDMNSCLSVNHEMYVCKQGGPLHHKGSLTSACEISFFNHLPAYDKCRIQKTGDEPHWIQLRNPNEWIYALRQETIVNVVCGQNTTSLTIRGSGIAKLQRECLMKQHFLTIRGHNIYPSTTRLSYNPLSNLTEAVIPSTGGALDTPQDLYQRHMSEVRMLQQNIEEFIKSGPAELPSHEVHHNIGYAGLILAVLTAIFLVTNCYTRARRNKQCIHPIPKPRRNIEQQQGIHNDRFNVHIDV